MWRAELKNAIPTPVDTSSSELRSRTASVRSPSKSADISFGEGRPLASARRSASERLSASTSSGGMSIRRAVVPVPPSSAARSSSTVRRCASSASTPTTLSSRTKASRYSRLPWVTSAPAARSQSGEKPKAAIEPSSTTLPAVLRTARRVAFGSYSSATPGGASTPPTSSIETRRRFLAVASYSRERRIRRGSTSSAVSCTPPPTSAKMERTARSGSDTRKARRPAIVSIIADGSERDSGAPRSGLPRRRGRRRGSNGWRRPFPGHHHLACVQRAAADPAAQAGQRSARRTARRRHHPRASHPNEGNRMSTTTLQDQIKQVIDTEPVVVFIKGSPEAPACGNSMRALQALWQAGAPITAVDVLPDPRIRQELSALSDWPTIPQVFVKGELIGGADITEELNASGELRQKIDEALGEHTQTVRTVELALA